MLRLKPSNVTPPDKFRFLCPIDQIQIVAMGKEEWYSKIREHYSRNGYEIPPDLFEKAEDQLCRQLSGEWCDGGTNASFINATRFTLDDFTRGTKVMASMFTKPDSLVSPDLAEKRALICSRCFLNQTVPGCMTCRGIAAMVVSVKGKRGTKHDHLLKACAVCHCSNESQIWVKYQHLKKGLTPEQTQTYLELREQGYECWKGEAIVSKKEEPVAD